MALLSRPAAVACSCWLFSGCLLGLAAAAVRAKACARVFCVSQPFLFCSLSSFSSLFITIITSHHHHYLFNQYMDIQVYIYIYISKARKRPQTSSKVHPTNPPKRANGPDIRQSARQGRKPPQTSSKVRREGANGRRLRARREESKRTAAEISAGRAAGGGDP